MKTLLHICAAVLILYALPASAADVTIKLPVADAMKDGKISSLFPGNVAFYWGSQGHPAVATNFGSFNTSKRTNALGKSRSDACNWAMASALEALQRRALREGGNAVINIESYINRIPESSETDFTCLAGTVMVNVALKGDVVTLGQ